MQYLIKRKNENQRTVYYKAFDGRKGVTCPKIDAPRFTEEMAQMIVRQLATTDNRGWEIAQV